MSKLYRIKPLEWEQHGHVHIAKTPVYEFRVGEHEEMTTFSIRPAGPEMENVLASSVDDAKYACRRWWETNALRFLESACQPTTELPTEPGLYWWRRSEDDPWRAIPVWALTNVILHVGDAKLSDWVKFNGTGQWVRIPEPEKN